MTIPGGRIEIVLPGTDVAISAASYLPAEYGWPAALEDIRCQHAESGAHIQPTEDQWAEAMDLLRLDLADRCAPADEDDDID